MNFKTICLCGKQGVLSRNTCLTGLNCVDKEKSKQLFLSF